MNKYKDFKTVFSKYVFQFDKIKYFQNKKNTITNCILCDISQNKNDSLLICYSELISVCVNLYPYNSGHIMIFPKKHIECYANITEEENFHIFTLTKFFIQALEKLYNPTGFNIGMNIGINSGASIRHIHQHLIPRFENELGMIDIIGGSKVIVESPITTLDRLKEYSFKNKDILPFPIY